jgi:hypothetical protein
MYENAKTIKIGKCRRRVTALAHTQKPCVGFFFVPRASLQYSENLTPPSLPFNKHSLFSHHVPPERYRCPGLPPVRQEGARGVLPCCRRGGARLCLGYVFPRLSHSSSCEIIAKITKTKVICFIHSHTDEKQKRKPHRCGSSFISPKVTVFGVTAR